MQGSTQRERWWQGACLAADQGWFPEGGDGNSTKINCVRVLGKHYQGPSGLFWGSSSSCRDLDTPESQLHERAEARIVLN